MSTDRENFLHLLSAVERHVRKAWKPQFSAQPEDLEPQATKYGGRPWLPNEVDWPRSSSGLPLNFVMQLDGWIVPEIARLHPNSLIQLYSVDSDDPALSESFDAVPGEHDPGFLTMVVEKSAAGSLRHAPQDAKRGLAALSVVDKWVEIDDHPCGFNLDAMAAHHPEMLAPLDQETALEMLVDGYADYIGGPPHFQSTLKPSKWADWEEGVHRLAKEFFALEDAQSFLDRCRRATTEQHGKIGGWAFTGPSGEQPAGAATDVPIYLLNWDDDPRIDRSLVHRGTGYLVQRVGGQKPDFVYGY